MGGPKYPNLPSCFVKLRAQTELTIDIQVIYGDLLYFSVLPCIQIMLP